MQKSIKFMALALVVLGVVLAWLAFMVSGKPSTASASAAPPTAAVHAPLQRTVVARRAIEAGHFLTSDDVQLLEVVQASAGAFVDASALVGRGVAQSLAAGDTITSSSLLSGISGMLQPGERAVSIKVDESTAVGHKVQPGDWVDVLVVFRKDGQEVLDTQSRRLLERRRVLAYGTQLELARVTATAKDKEGTASKSDAAVEQMRANNPARTAVLAVRADEVNPLMLAERQGQVMLALRSPLEPVVATTAPAIAGMVSMASAHESGLKLAASQDVVTLEHLAAHGDSQAGAKVLSVMPAKVPPMPTRPISVDKPRAQATGMAVEFIRGTRTETVHY